MIGPFRGLKSTYRKHALLKGRVRVAFFIEIQEEKGKVRSRYAKELDISSLFACPDQHEILLKPTIKKAKPRSFVESGAIDLQHLADHRDRPSR
jgi:hypothetical protein